MLSNVAVLTGKGDTERMEHAEGKKGKERNCDDTAISQSDPKIVDVPTRLKSPYDIQMSNLLLP